MSSDTLCIPSPATCRERGISGEPNIGGWELHREGIRPTTHSPDNAGHSETVLGLLGDTGGHAADAETALLINQTWIFQKVGLHEAGLTSGRQILARAASLYEPLPWL